MARLYGQDYDKAALLARVDDMSQIAGVRAARLEHGLEDGVSVLDMYTGGGLRFTIVPSRGMDISAADYQGTPLCPRATCREAHPAHLELGLDGWRRGFFEGLLTTCGPTFPTAPPQPYELRPANHGRATYTPARCVSYDERWQGDEYLLSASGRMRQDNLVWERQITTQLGAKHLLIRDRVENQHSQPVHHRFQYHINAGFPVVDETSYFAGSSLGLYGRQGQSIDVDFRQMAPPRDEPQQGAMDELMVADEDGYVWAMILNPSFRGHETLGYYVRYRIDTLPHFILWKCLTPERYIVGTEPASHPPVNAFAPNLETGSDLSPMAPEEVRCYEIEIGVIDSAAQAQALQQQMDQAVARYAAAPDKHRDAIGTTCTGRHGH